jgi:hypothetical protein
MADWVVFDCVILGFLWYCVDIYSGWELEFLVLWVADRGGILWSWNRLGVLVGRGWQNEGVFFPLDGRMDGGWLREFMLFNFGWFFLLLSMLFWCNFDVHDSFKVVKVVALKTNKKQYLVKIEKYLESLM